jgi:hypothetical protein
MLFADCLTFLPAHRSVFVLILSLGFFPTTLPPLFSLFPHFLVVRRPSLDRVRLGGLATEHKT